jgi:putative spermidine/putrescine transport system permease protein
MRFPPDAWSTKWYEKFVNDDSWRSATFASLQIALLVAILATVLGTLASVSLARSRARWAGAARGFLIAPMIVPGIIIAIGVYYLFLEWRLTETQVGFVLAHTMLAVPIVIITVTASLQSFDQQMARAASSLGAGPVATFRKVTLPLILPGVLSGTLFAFLTSFDESIVALFLSGPGLRTLPIQIYLSVTSALDPTIAAASTLVMAFTTALLLLFGYITIRQRRVQGDV